MLRQLALEVELDRADATAEQLRVQRGQALGQVGERPQVGELLGRQRRRVDRVARQVAREHRGHLFGDVERDRDLRLERRGRDVRRGDEVGQREQRVVARRLVSRTRPPPRPRGALP